MVGEGVSDELAVGGDGEVAVVHGPPNRRIDATNPEVSAACCSWTQWSFARKFARRQQVDRYRCHMTSPMLVRNDDGLAFDDGDDRGRVIVSSAMSGGAYSVDCGHTSGYGVLNQLVEEPKCPIRSTRCSLR